MVKKLVAARNARNDNALIFYDGFPAVMGGSGAIKNKCSAFINMARSGILLVVLVDLDAAECACSLLRSWFVIPENEEIALLPQCIFRVAVREVESWILADHLAWAHFIGIREDNFAMPPDELLDPKGHILRVLRKKGRKKIHREMLPRGAAHVGPRYNEILCDFVNNYWAPERAARRSPSLDRAWRALLKI